MEGKGNFFILLIIIAVLTLTLAILAGYLFFVAGSPQAAGTPTGVKAEETQVKKPSDNELASKILFTEPQYFNLKSADDAMSVIQVNIELIYFKNPKGIRNVAEKLTFNDIKIKEIVGTYFQGLTLEDVKQPEMKQRASSELSALLNDYLTANEKSKVPIIYELRFDKWFYQ